MKTAHAPARGELARIDQREPARSLLDPVRLRILELAQEPTSATEVGRVLAMPRQKVNYHFKELSRQGLLAPAGERTKRNMVEQLYVASARHFMLAPELIAPVGLGPRAGADRFSAAYVLGLAVQTQSELGRAQAEAAQQGKHLSTLGISVPVRFASAEQRGAFAAALEQAITDVVARFTSPYRDKRGHAGAGRPYRLVLGCYPIPPANEDKGEP
jgi:hypothetical protein